MHHVQTGKSNSMLALRQCETTLWQNTAFVTAKSLHISKLDVVLQAECTSHSHWYRWVYHAWPVQTYGYLPRHRPTLNFNHMNCNWQVITVHKWYVSTERSELHCKYLCTERSWINCDHPTKLMTCTRGKQNSCNYGIIVSHVNRTLTGHFTFTYMTLWHFTSHYIPCITVN